MDETDVHKFEALLQISVEQHTQCNNFARILPSTVLKERNSGLHVTEEDLE